MAAYPNGGTPPQITTTQSSLPYTGGAHANDHLAIGALGVIVGLMCVAYARIRAAIAAR